MASATTKLIPIPDDTDQVLQGAAAIRALGTDLDFTKIVQLAPTAVNATTPLENYPLGVSQITLTAADASTGGWPGAVAGAVWTFKAAGGDRASQLFFRASQTTPSISYRTLASAGAASPWAQLATVTSSPQAAGSGIAPIPNNTTWGSITVTFPAGRFTTPPAVSATPGDTAGQAAAGCAAYNITATSARMGVRLVNVASGALNAPFSWIAMEIG